VGLITVRAWPPAGYTAAGAAAQRAATQAPEAQVGFQESNISSHAESEPVRGGLSTVPQNVPQTANCPCSPYPNTLPQSSADRPRLTRYTSIALWYHPTKCNSYMPGILQVSYAIPAQVQASSLRHCWEKPQGSKTQTGPPLLWCITEAHLPPPLQRLLPQSCSRAPRLHSRPRRPSARAAARRHQRRLPRTRLNTSRRDAL
jgi:hypothetical protein